MKSEANAIRTRRRGLSALARSTSGNAMFIVAAAMIPLMGIIGGAVDFSRAYLVKQRLQQACDAGALAGRRSMVGKTITATDKSEALRFFFFNFPNGTMDTATMDTVNANAANRVTIALTSEDQFGMQAATLVPTTLLRIINIPNIPVAVNCVGEEFYVNTDIMLVLDTTGSMNCDLGADDSCAASAESSNSKSKMHNMRTAIKNLFDDLVPARDALKLKELRMRIGFVQYSQNVNVGKILYNIDTNYIRNPYTYYNSKGSLKKSSTDHSEYWFKNTWNGCIEERETVSTITKNSQSIPSGAFDLDMETMPTSDATRWGPSDPSAEESEGSSSTANACPRPAVALQEWPDTKAFKDHVDTIKTGIGRTHHDSGIIWGTRMIAPVGIFKDTNPTIYNLVKVSKTIVFMTDGQIDIAPDYYTAYGVPATAGRTATKSTSEKDLEAIHERRFSLMCARAKDMGIDIWVVAILKDSNLSSAMQGCASDTSQAIKVGNAQQLSDAFKRISDKVGNLRIGS